MYTIFTGVKTFLKCKKLHVDHCIFRLHYKVSFFLLLASCALVGSKQYAGEPIKCSINSQEYSTLVDIYCFVTTTYSVRSALNKTPADGAPHPGVYASQDQADFRYHAYYQWIGFLLFFQAVLFYFPHWLWKRFEGGQVVRLLERGEGCSGDPEVSRLKHKLKITGFLKKRWKKENQYCYKYFFCEFLCLANVVGQMFLLNKVFNEEYLSYGIEVVQYLRHGRGGASPSSPFDRIFPRVTSCTYNYYGPGGTVRKVSVLCVLAVNAINDKVFLFLWFWLWGLSTLTLFALSYKLALFSSRRLRLRLLRVSFVYASPEHLRFVAREGNAGDYLMLYLLGQNLDPFFFGDVVEELVGRLQEKEC